jgi:hypothetical protein
MSTLRGGACDTDASMATPRLTSLTTHRAEASHVPVRKPTTHEPTSESELVASGTVSDDFCIDVGSPNKPTDHLRVLIANERKDRLGLVARAVVTLGHEVIAREIEVGDVGPVTARERPDVALVGLGESSEHALELIDKIVREAACPVIALLHAPDRQGSLQTWRVRPHLR